MNATLAQVLAAKRSPIVHRVDRDCAVSEAVAQMCDLGVGCMLIVSKRGRPLGIFTERDLMRRVVAKGLAAGTTLVKDVMTSPLVTVRKRTTVAAALELCSARRFRRLPVVELGRVTGLVTVGDLTRWLVDHQRAQINELNDYIWGPEGRSSGEVSPYEVQDR